MCEYVQVGNCSVADMGLVKEGKVGYSIKCG